MLMDWRWRPVDGGDEWRFSKRFILGLVAFYIILTQLTVGIRPEHVISCGLTLILGFTNPRLCRFVLVLIPLIAIPFVFEIVLPMSHHIRGPIHVGSVYDLERLLFPAVGVSTNTWPEYFVANNLREVDLVCGLIYMLSVPQMFIFAAVLFVVRPLHALPFTFTCLVVYLLAYTTHTAVPVAPPWYLMSYGPGPAIENVPASAAGLARLDDVLGFQFATSYYAKSSHVFGAFPSLHIATPTIVIVYSIGLGWRWLLPSVIFALLTAFGAIYFNHHYVVDVVGGIAYALFAYAAVALVIQKLIRPEQHGTGPSQVAAVRNTSRFGERMSVQSQSD